MKTWICQNPKCGREFTEQYPTQSRPRKYCCPECSSEARKGRPHLSHRGENHPRWKGGKVIDKHGGYVWVKRQDGSGGRTGLQNYIAEHRLVMEQLLGRPLTPTERVHHRNGIRTDNRPENLELWTVGHPAGQRVEDVPHCPTCTCHQIMTESELHGDMQRTAEMTVPRPFVRP